MTKSISSDWLPEENISQNSFSSFLSESGGTNHTGLTIDSKNQPHVVWYGSSPARLFYSMKTGVSWTTPLQLTSSSTQAKWPSIAIDSTDRLHLVWHDYRHASTTFNVEIYYNSATLGESWNHETRLTDTQDINLTNGDAGYSPTIWVDSINKLHVIWYDFHWDGYRPDLGYKTTSSGFNWDTTENIDSNRITFTQLYEQPFPSLTSDTANNIHLVWIDDSSGNLEIYYKGKSAQSGLWATETSLTNDTAFSINPVIISDSNNNLYLFWSDTRDGNSEIYMKKYNSLLGEWEPDQRMTSATGDSNHPSAMADNQNNIHLVWDDTRDGNQKIYYKKYDSNLQAWSPDTAISTGSGNSRYPGIAVDHLENIHILWQDNRDGNDEIYYRKLEYTTAVQKESWSYLE